MSSRLLLLMRRRDTGVDWWASGGAPAPWAVYQPKGAASLAASYTDLSGNGRDAGVGVAPTWNATDGWIFNGSDQYLTTTFTPSNDQTQSVLIQFTGASNDGTMFGFWTSFNVGLRIQPQDGTGTEVRYQNGNSTSVAPAIAAGNLAVAGAQGYRNGTANGGAIGAYGVGAIGACYIACRNSSGATDFQAINIQALAIYDVTLTSDQVAAVAAAMAAL